MADKESVFYHSTVFVVGFLPVTGASNLVKTGFRDTSVMQMNVGYLPHTLKSYIPGVDT